MSIQEVVPERFAELFHHYQQALAPDCNCGEERTSETWSHMPAREKNRLIAAAQLALEELESEAREQENLKRYFAKPGEAEWGC